ncbi:MAG: hypothetical protein IPO90_04310 [Flavobacteriales bacterium]|nr:hypothetical protein [Flavobacteriales bacterium]
MRNWLFSSAVLGLLLVFGCCGHKDAATGATDNNTPAGSDGKTRTEAPKHNAPDQDRIDSLKREKQKEKP